jgi:hypothetical protein
MDVPLLFNSPPPRTRDRGSEGDAVSSAALAFRRPWLEGGRPAESEKALPIGESRECCLYT